MDLFLGTSTYVKMKNVPPPMMNWHVPPKSQSAPHSPVLLTRETVQGVYEVPEFEKDWKNIGKCASCHNYGHQCTWSTFWQRLVQNCPEVVINSDHMNSPKVGGTGMLEYNDTPHELQTENCFGFAVGASIIIHLVPPRTDWKLLMTWGSI